MMAHPGPMYYPRVLARTGFSESASRHMDDVALFAAGFVTGGVIVLVAWWASRR